MDGDECIVQVRGVRPFLSKKYDIKSMNGTKNYQRTIRSIRLMRKST